MGGDYAPSVCIEGSGRALQDFPDIHLVLVGHEKKLAYYLDKFGLSGHSRISIAHADSVVEMSEPSTASIRGKKDSSITACAKLLKSKEVAAMVSPGHTGALVAATKVLVRTLPGVDRPALAASLPQRGGRFLLMDAGANTNCTALNLVQFAVMGSVYASYLLGKDDPRVGLLSVGSEDGKGNELTKSVFKSLVEMPINFIGNVEGNSAFEDATDVLIADGFSGNVLLKTTEGFSKISMHWLKEALSKNFLRYTGAMLAKNAFRELKSYGDASEIGGAPLLGLNGICIIGHGSSNPWAVRNQIRVAKECHQFGLNEKITQRIAECKDFMDALN